MATPVSGINPQLLIWARQTAGQTVADVAAAIKKDPAVIRSWEEGTSAPTYVQLETLAYKVFKRPIAVFFFPEPPEEIEPEKAFRTLPDAEIENLASDTRLKVREARAMQLALAELSDGKNPALRHILRDITAEPTAPSQVATRVREYLGISVSVQTSWKNTDVALKAWRSAVEETGVFVFKDSFKQRDVSGFSLYDSVFPLILINNSTAPARQIFTLFHELGHLLAHESGITKRDDRYIRLLSGDHRRVEIFANQFAADVLVPRNEIAAAIKDFGTSDEAVGEIAAIFKVSREVVLRRMLDLGLVTSQRYEQSVAKWTAEYEAAVAETGGGGNYYYTHAAYLSDQYARLAFANYYRGAISIEQLAEYLNVRVGSVPGLEQALLQKALS